MKTAFCSSVAIFSCTAVLLTQSAQALPARSTTSLVASQRQGAAEGFAGEVGLGWSFAGGNYASPLMTMAPS